MAKGIPIIGRAPDKRAKIVNVDELGNLKVSQLESKLDGIENKLVTLEQRLIDGNQKVQVSGNIVVDTENDLPSSGYMGQTALVKAGKRVFVHDGSKWGEW